MRGKSFQATKLARRGIVEGLPSGGKGSGGLELEVLSFGDRTPGRPGSQELLRGRFLPPSSDGGIGLWGASREALRCQGCAAGVEGVL